MFRILLGLLIFVNTVSISLAEINPQKAVELSKNIKTITAVRSSVSSSGATPGCSLGCTQASFTFPVTESLEIVWNARKDFKNGVKTEDVILNELETFWLQNKDEYGSFGWSKFIYDNISALNPTTDDFDTLMAIFFMYHFDASNKIKHYLNVRTYFAGLGYTPTDIDNICSPSTDSKFVGYLDWDL